MNKESLYEYGARAGFWRLWRSLHQPLTCPATAGVARRWRERPTGRRHETGELEIMAVCDG